MSKLWITEYTTITRAGPHGVPVGAEPGTDQSPVDFTSGATQSARFSDGTIFIRVSTDADCHFVIGANPTATTSNKPLWSKATEYFGVSALGLKLSVIADS